MPRRSLANIKLELARNEYSETLEQISQEKIQLANFVEENSSLDFEQAFSIIEMLCEEILSGYRGADKLFVFRRQIRDRLMDSIRQRKEIENHQDWVEHEELCTCPPAVRYGVDIPGLGCEVCPYCAEKLDEHEIPF